MKKFFLLLLVVLPSLSISQNSKVIKNLTSLDRKVVHFGFTVGLNSVDFSLNRTKDFAYSNLYSVESISGYGFHIGPIISFRLMRFLDFRALFELSFGDRLLEYRFKNEEGKEPDFYTKNVNVESIFMELPMMLKYKAVRIRNYRPYIIGGVSPRYDLVARKSLKSEEIGEKIKLKPFDINYEVGFGIDYYLPYFKFSTEFKYSFGTRDIIDRDGTILTDHISKMQSKMFIVSFHFEG